jgi:hypothetical protein
MRVQKIGGNVNTIFLWMRLAVNDYIIDEKVEIEEFMQKVQENNFDQQSRILINEL